MSAAELLHWYDRHRRTLPWRALPGEEPDPYRVWLSEIMLQQTTVATVGPRFQAFVERWPDVAALAEARREDVLAEWAGLGYYARARNLHACAIAVMDEHGGRFPETEAALLTLPGIGAYTAGAIAAIAFGQKTVAVDGNVERVIARYRGIEEPLPGAKKAIRTAALALVPAERPGDFAQAMMDLGATVCTPKRPACSLCPWNVDCAALARGLAGQLPRKKPKPEKPTRRGAAFWLEDGQGRALLVRRPDRGLLGGMTALWCSPFEEGFDEAALLSHAPLAADWRRLPGSVRHTFTHFHLDLAVYAGKAGSVDVPDGFWLPLEDVAGAGLPTVMRKAVQHALDKN